MFSCQMRTNGRLVARRQRQGYKDELVIIARGTIVIQSTLSKRTLSKPDSKFGPLLAE